jgi:hypothetical protein
MPSNVTPHRQSIALSEEQIFRLWKAAIQDNDRLADEVIRRVYREMKAYDLDRFQEVIYLTITRKIAAGRALSELLDDIPMFQGASSPSLDASTSF